MAEEDDVIELGYRDVSMPATFKDFADEDGLSWFADEDGLDW